MAQLSSHSPDDPFDILGLDPGYRIDPGGVERRWLGMSATLHPDRARDPVEAAGRLAMVNRAREVLLDPERRADALLVRLGGPTREQHRSLPEGFLVEIMEIRERAEEARMSRDPGARSEVERWAIDQRRMYDERVAAMFDGLGPSPGIDGLRAIRVELNGWRYIERMIEQLD